MIASTEPLQPRILSVGVARAGSSNPYGRRDGPLLVELPRRDDARGH